MKYVLLLLLICISFAKRLQAQQTRTVYFGFNQFGITLQTIDSLKVWMVQNKPNGTITINGHTDASGSNRYNQALSQKRAKAVADALLLFCDSCSFQIESFGEAMPVSYTKQALNRRVEITWTSGILTTDTVQATVSNPPPDTLTAIGKLLEIPALEKIYFVPDKAVIEASSLPYVQELASVLRTYPKRTMFEIRGHSNAPGEKFIRLSEGRAKEIYLHLIDLGIPATNLRYKGLGNKYPAFAHPKNEAEMRRNIRVDIVVY